MKIITQTILIVLAALNLNAQILFQEDFETNSIPSDWTIITQASDGGWIAGSSASLSSQAFGIVDNGSNFFVATNDDRCNCNKSNDLLITPEIDLSGVTNAVLSFDLYYWNRVYGGLPESFMLEITTDQGANWTLIQNFDGNSTWNKRSIDISAYAGNEKVQLGFRYNDGGGWLYGTAIDNVTVFDPNMLDGQLLDFKLKEFAEEGDGIPIEFTVFNNGIQTITDLEISYAVNGSEIESEIFNNLGIQGFKTRDLSFSNSWISDQIGNNNIEVSIKTVNGIADEDNTNNTISNNIEIFEKVIVPNKIDEYLNNPTPIMIEVANSSHGLDKPNDLDFYPILALNELWVTNERLENSGGSTTTLYNAGKEDQSHLWRTDGNAWHFMSLPTGIAFSENGNFATSTGVLDANHGGGSFTGPTLWDSDPAVYAQPSGGNGSHIDMLHGSPYCMGIAAERDNVFWVFDSFNGMPVRYDFVEDHGPGNDDHSDGIIRRYSEISIKRDNDLPSHMVLDGDKKWLYFVDGGNKRVMRLDINTGVVGNPLPLINEQLFEHSQMTGVTFETIIDIGLERPAGIEIIDNRLLVGDYATGEIIVYDVNNNFAELGRIDIGLEGLTGLKIGPEGFIWCTNKLLNTLYRLEPNEATSVNDPLLLSALSIYPNPATDFVNINMQNDKIGEDASFKVYDTNGRLWMNSKFENRNAKVYTSDLPNGVYFIKLQSGSELLTKEFVVIHK